MTKDTSSAYVAIGDSGADPNTLNSARSKRSTRSKLVVVLGICLFVSVGVVAYFQLASSGSSDDDSSAQHQITFNSDTTNKAFNRLNDAVANSQLVLTASLLDDASASELFTSTIGTDSLTITNPVLGRDSEQHITVTGGANVLSYDTSVAGSLFYDNAGSAFLRVTFTPTSGEMSLPQLVPEEQLDPAHATLQLSSTAVLLSSYDDDAASDTPVERGLSVKGNVTLDGDSRLKQIAEFVEAKVAMLWGKLKPGFNVGFHLPDVHLGKTVNMTEIEVKLEKKEPVFNLTALVGITPPSAGAIMLRSGATFDLTNKQITLAGNLSQPWDFPGKLLDDRLVLSDMHSALTVAVTKPANNASRIVAGSVTGAFAYGDVKLSMGLDYPASDSVDKLAYELIVDDSNVHLPSIPCFPESFPQMTAESAALLLSPYDGQHCWTAAGAPTAACVTATTGLNVYGRLDFSANAPSLSLPEDTQVFKMLLQGSYSKDKGLHAQMNGPDTVALTPSLSLTAVNFTFDETFAPASHVTTTLGAAATLVLPTATAYSAVDLQVHGSIDSPKVVLELDADFLASNDRSVEMSMVHESTVTLRMAKGVVTYDNSDRTTNVAINTTGTVAGLAVEADLTTTLHFDSADTTHTCYDALFKVNDKIPLSTLTSSIVGQDTTDNFLAGGATEVPTAGMNIFNTTLENLSFEAKLLCHSVSLSFDLDNADVFGEVFVDVEYARFVDANKAVAAIAAEANEPSSLLASQQAAIATLSANTADVTTAFADPYPETSLCAYLNPLNDLLIAAANTTTGDAAAKLKNASAAVTTLLAIPNVCAESFASGPASQLAPHAGFAFAMVPVKGWQLDQSFDFGPGLAGDAFPTLSAYNPMFSLTSTDILLKVDAKIHGAGQDEIHVNLTKPVKLGFSVSFKIHPDPPVDKLTEAIHWVMPHVEEIDVTGTVTKTREWSLQGTVPDGEIDFGAHLDMTDMLLLIESTAPHLKLGSTVAVVEHEKSFKFDSMAVINGLTNLSFTAHSDETWVFSIGHYGLNVTALGLNLTLAPPKTGSVPVYSVAITGDLELGDAHLNAVISSTTADVLVLNATLSEDKPLSLGAAVEDLTAGTSGMTFATEIVEPLLGSTAFAGASLSVDVGARTLFLEGRILVFGGESEFELTVAQQEMADQTKQWGFTVGAAWASAKKFSDFAPAISSLDALQIGPPALVLSTAEGDATFSFPEVRPDNPYVTYKVVRGLNFFASLDIDQDSKAMQWITHYTGVERLVLNMDIQSLQQFEARGELEGSFKILPMTHLTELGFVLVVKPTEVSAGIDATALVEPKSGGPLTLYGRVLAGDLGIAAKFATENDWENVAGLNGLTISRADLEGEISYELVPLSFGVAGGMHYGAIGGEADFIADLTLEDHFAVRAEVDDCVLADMVDSCCSAFIHPSATAQVLLETGVQKAVLVTNPSPETISFNGLTFAPGTLVEVDQLLILGWINATAKVYVGEKGVSVEGSVQPFSFGSFLEVGGYSPDGVKHTPAMLNVSLIKDQPQMFRLDAAISLFEIELGTLVDFSDQGVHLAVAFHADNLLNFTIDCAAEGELKHPTDFSVHGLLNNELLNYLNETLPEKLKEAKAEYDDKFGDATARLESLRDQLDGLQRQIDERRASDQRAVEDAQRKLEEAQSAVRSAEESVNHLQTQIDSVKSEISHLKWYQEWKAVPLGAELAGLYIAKETALGALEIADAALELAKKAVPAITPLDPELDALMAAYGLAQAGISALEATLKGVNKVLDNILDIESRVIGELSYFFNPEKVELSGSLKQIKTGNLGHLEIQGWFFHDHIAFSVDANLALGAQILSKVWSWFAHRFGDDGRLAYEQFRM